MPTEHELARRRARTAWWLRTCRLTDPREPPLAAVATAAGLGAGSGSVVSLWERNRAPNGPKLDQLHRLAAYYGVPVTLFTNPPATDEERLARYRQLALGALEAEREDWAQEAEEGGPDDEDGHDAPPSKRSA